MADAGDLSRLAARLAGTITHDVNGALGVIVGRLSLLEAQLDDKTRPHYESIKRATDKALGIVNAFGSLARIGAPQRSAVKLASLLPSEPGLKVDTAFTVPSMQVDQDQFAVLFRDLIQNAREAGATSLSIASRAVDGGVELTFADSGPGVPEALRPRLFQPLVTTKTTKGSGYGLARAFRVADVHGGSASYDGQFRFFFPSA